MKMKTKKNINYNQKKLKKNKPKSMTDIVFADQFDFSLFIDRFKKDVMEIVNEKVQSTGVKRF